MYLIIIYMMLAVNVAMKFSSFLSYAEGEAFSAFTRTQFLCVVSHSEHMMNVENSIQNALVVGSLSMF